MTNTKLDKWLAENVMGWHIRTFLTGEFADGAEWYCDSVHPIIKINDWHPTESIADAMVVVDKMVEKGWYVEIHIDGSNTNFCCFVSPDLDVEKNALKKTMERVHSATESEPSLAISLAAKRAWEAR